MSLTHAEQFRAAPFLMNGFDIRGTSDRIEIAGDEQHAGGLAERLVMHRRAKIKMPRHEGRLDFYASQLASHENRSRTLPDGVFDVDDRRHQCHETEIALHA